MPVAIITGASSGIGEGLARELHRRGFHVGLVARRGDKLEQIVASLGERCALAAADVAEADEVNRAITALETSLGPCDLLVANAGEDTSVPGTQFDLVTARRLARVNYEGALNAVGAVLPGMMARGKGHLVAISSLAAWRGMPRSGPYSASKAALTMLFESLRLDLADTGIVVTTVHPGWVDTPMTKKHPYPMPFLQPVDRIARQIADGIERQRSQIDLPWQLALVMRLLRVMPNALFDRILRRADPRH
jgi:short-subunit dehydrogenase